MTYSPFVPGGDHSTVKQVPGVTLPRRQWGQPELLQLPLQLRLFVIQTEVLPESVDRQMETIKTPDYFFFVRIGPPVFKTGCFSGADVRRAW